MQLFLQSAQTELKNGLIQALTNSVPNLIWPEDPYHYELALLVYDKNAQEDLLAQIRQCLSQRPESPLLVCTNFAVPNKNPLLVQMRPPTWTLHDISERIAAELLCRINTRREGAAVGDSPRMRDLHQRMTKLARLEEPLLITGETGTGKNVFAAEVHRLSKRPGELNQHNTAEFGDRLIPELFGHLKGAYTGADRDRKGLIVEAGAGTFFLDEIGELAPDQQAQLLSAIETRTVRPLGSNKKETYQARLLFATHKNLETMVQQGTFREDLYHRLSTYSLVIPPLRERRLDILLLADHFLKEFNQKYGTQLQLPDSTRDFLFGFDWPANVRQLRNSILAAAALSDDQFAEQELLDRLSRERPTSAQTHGRNDQQIEFDINADTWEDVTQRLKSAYFRALLAKYPAKAEAAIQAGISKARIYEIVNELGFKEKL